MCTCRSLFFVTTLLKLFLSHRVTLHACPNRCCRHAVPYPESRENLTRWSRPETNSSVVPGSALLYGTRSGNGCSPYHSCASSPPRALFLSYPLSSRMPHTASLLPTVLFPLCCRVYPHDNNPDCHATIRQRPCALRQSPTCTCNHTATPMHNMYMPPYDHRTNMYMQPYSNGHAPSGNAQTDATIQ